MVVSIDPNQFKLIEVPVAVVGEEVAGMVYLKENLMQKGQGRVDYAFLYKDSILKGNTVNRTGWLLQLPRSSTGILFCNTRHESGSSVEYEGNSCYNSVYNKKIKRWRCGRWAGIFLQPLNADTSSRVQLKTGDREQLQPIPLKKEQEEVKTVIQNQDTQKPARIEQKNCKLLKNRETDGTNKETGAQGNHQEISTIRNESPGTVEYIIQVGAFRNESWQLQLRSAFRKCCTAMLKLLMKGSSIKFRYPRLQELKRQRISFLKFLLKDLHKLYYEKDKKMKTKTKHLPDQFMKLIPGLYSSRIFSALWLETLIDGAVILDKNGQITYANQSICRLTGFSKEELTGSKYLVFIDHAEHSSLKNIFSDSGPNGE